MLRLVPLVVAAMAAMASLVRPAPARAAEHVDVALVIVDDVSSSIDDDEFNLQKAGYYAAFTNPAVVAAMTDGHYGRIAVSYVEFAAAYQVRTVLDWTIIKDAASASAFAQALRDTPRAFHGRTAIGSGIDEAMRDLANVPAAPDRQVIDVCGDGTSNTGRDVIAARDDALAKGVVINGLALANESSIGWLQAHTHPPGGLGNYYREHVIGGEGSFVIEIHDYASFAEAIRRKLIEEVALAGPSVPQRR